MSRTVVIGVGNEFRGDDGVGRMTARRIASHAPESVTVHESTGEALSLMELWSHANRVILIDATAPSGAPGSVERHDASEHALPSDCFHTSTHAFSVADGIEMARALGQLPRTVIVYGIEGESFDHGARLTSAAARGVEETVNRILAELSAPNSQP